MNIKTPNPNDSEIDRVRRRIHREWMLSGSRLPSLLLDGSAELDVVGPFGVYRPADPNDGWQRTGDEDFESMTVHVPRANRARHRFANRYLVADRIAGAIVAIADFGTHSGLGSIGGLRLGTGSVTSALGESLRLLETELSKVDAHDEAELMFLVDPEHEVTVILAKAPKEVLATTIPPAHCWPSAVIALQGDTVMLRRVPGVQRYSFECDEDKRVRGTGDSLRRALATLLDRIDLDAGVLRRLDNDGTIRRLLERFCNDYVLNIDWYDRHVLLQRRWRIVWIASFLVVGAVAVTLAICMAWILKGANPGANPGGTAELGAQLTVLVGGVGGVLKAMSSLGDTKSRLAIFWKARSELKERLYRFEHRWRGRVVIDGHIPPAFIADVQEQLEAAGRISREEQLGFFATYKDPTDVIDSLMSTAEKLTKGAAPTTASSGQRARARNADHLAIIQGNVDRCATRVAELKAQSASASEIDQAESALAVVRSTLSNLMAS